MVLKAWLINTNQTTLNAINEPILYIGLKLTNQGKSNSGINQLK